MSGNAERRNVKRKPNCIHCLKSDGVKFMASKADEKSWYKSYFYCRHCEKVFAVHHKEVDNFEWKQREN